MWVCECGAIGNVVPMYSPVEGETLRRARRVELTEALALNDHGRHLHDVREEVAAASERALAAIGSDIQAANATLLRRGRWGRA